MRIEEPAVGGQRSPKVGEYEYADGAERHALMQRLLTNGSEIAAVKIHRTYKQRRCVAN